MDDDDGSKSVWFRERVGLGGYGYTPSSWQGWLVTAIFSILALGTIKLASSLIPSHFPIYWWFAVLALCAVYYVVLLKIVSAHCDPP